MRFSLITLTALLFVTIQALSASDEVMSEDAYRAQFEHSLTWHSGLQELEHGSNINIPAGYRFLQTADARRVLEEAWGNPPDPEIMGMIFPSDRGPFADDSWAVVISFENIGYVSDDDAQDIDYDEMLVFMQEQTSAANEYRVRQGYGRIELRGWATDPTYNAHGHEMVWAEQLHFEGEAMDTLNYNLRVLGRKGVLILNAVAGMNQLAEIEPAMEDLRMATEFRSGHRYEEFDPSTDKSSDMSVAAMVAGGAYAASKVSFFGKILAALLVAKKFVIIAVIAIGAFAFKVFTNRARQ